MGTVDVEIPAGIARQQARREVDINEQNIFYRLI